MKLFSNIVSRLKNNKKLETIVYSALLLFAAVIFFASGGISSCGRKDAELSAKESDEYSEEYESADSLGSRLEEILSSIEGAGKVRVMICYESGSEIVPALDSQKSETEGGMSETTKPVTVTRDGKQTPLILTELTPKIRGVIVVAEGGRDIRVRTELQNAVVTVLGTDPSRVSVFSMKH